MQLGVGIGSSGISATLGTPTPVTPATPVTTPATPVTPITVVRTRQPANLGRTQRGYNGRGNMQATQLAGIATELAAQAISTGITIYRARMILRMALQALNQPPTPSMLMWGGRRRMR